MTQVKLASVATALIFTIAGVLTRTAPGADITMAPTTAPSATTEPAQVDAPAVVQHHAVVFGGGMGQQHAGMMQWGVNNFSPLSTTPGDGLPSSKTLQTIEDLNVSPDFSLTADEKKKILTARQECKEIQAKYMKDHQPDLDQLQKTMQQASAQQNQQELIAAMMNLQQINREGSNTDVMDSSIEDALTPEHKKMLEEKLSPQSVNNNFSPPSIKPAPAALPGQ